MSQVLPADFPIDPTTTSGTALSQVINRFADAEHTNNSGATAPPNTAPGMFWLDTSGSADGALKMRDGLNAAWVPVFNSALPPVTSAGGTFTGNVTISNTDPALVLNRTGSATAHLARVLGQVGGLARWELQLGDGTAEAGANAGSLFQLRRFTDAGAAIDAPFSIDRATGRVTVLLGTAASPSFSLGDSSVGLFRPGGNVLGVAIAGASVAQFGALGLSLPDAVQVGASATATQNLTLRSNKDGTFTLARGNAGATTQDILTIDAAGAVATPQMVFSFSAWMSVAQTIAVTTPTVVQLQTKDYDYGGRYNNSNAAVGGIPAWAFKPTVPGVYNFSGSVAIAATPCVLIPFFYKNGAEFRRGNVGSNTSSNGGVTADIYCNGTTDYVQLATYLNLGQDLAATSFQTWFCGHLVAKA